MPQLRKGKQTNNFSNNAAGTSVQKIVLRRVPTKEEIIKKNLSNLKQNVLKKKVAQEYYYNKNNDAGQSPLKRQGLRIRKAVVQNRLGVNETMIFTNKNQRQTNQRPNNLNGQRKLFTKKRQQQAGNVGTGQRLIIRNTVANNRMQRFTKKQSVQQRILQIRQDAKNTNAQSMPTKIRLRRLQPVNYEIQVQTNGDNVVVAKKKQAQTNILNPRLQAEIKAIQTKPPVEGLPTSRTAQSAVAFGTTTLTLSERFTGLM